MPATNKQDLLTKTTDEFAKFRKAIDQIPQHLTLSKDDEGLSPKDIVGHRAHWIDLFLGWYSNGQAGNDQAIPAPGYKWNDLTRYNAALRASQAPLSWVDVCDMLNTNHARLCNLINTLDNNALYGGPMKGGKSAWTTGRWAEANGASHYRSATKYLRKRLRDAD